MPQEPTVTVLPRGVSGHPEGSVLGQVHAKRAGASGGRPRISDPETGRKKGWKWTPAARAKLSASMKRAKGNKGGAARATTGAGSKSARVARPPASDAMTAAPPTALAVDVRAFRLGEPEPGTVPAPGSLAAKPGRDGRLRACIEELTVERDSLTVIIEHLERLVS